MRKKRFIRLFFVMGLVALLGMNTTLQIAAKSTNKSDLKNKAESTSLSQAKKEKKALEKQLKDAEKLISDLKESREGVADKVAELNTQLMNISAQITSLENQLTEKGNEIANAQAALKDAKEAAAKQYEDMKVRIQYMYENSQESYAEMLLSSENMSDFLNSAEYIAQIQEYDRQKLADYETVVEEITRMEAQLKQDYADLEEIKKTVEEEKQYVASVMHQKEKELANISSNISSAQSDADYFAAEIQAQEELIAEIQRIEAEKAAAGVVDNPYTGGAFTWPCPSSTRITSDYGPRTSPTGGASSNHKGIDIGASHGAAIVAAADGVVKSATYSSTAGNYVMIDHGGGLYTVYMHCSSISVSVGQKVTAGQTIAGVGSTGISTGNHLHFGVSLNGSYVNPWTYLKG